MSLIISEIMMGLIIGYIVLCISESASHNHFLHGSHQIRKIWSKFGKIGKYILNSWYSHHVVHHYRTFKNDYITQFQSEEEELRLREDLISKGKKQIVLNSYGLRVGSPKEWLKYLYPHLPHYILLCFLGGKWFTIGALFPLFFYEWLAHFVHPYVHMPYDKALKTSPKSIRWFLLTPYFKFLAQHHYLHHKYVNCNFNLLLGGDILWKNQRFANKDDIIEMKKLGLFVNSYKLVKSDK